MTPSVDSESRTYGSDNNGSSSSGGYRSYDRGTFETHYYDGESEDSRTGTREVIG